SMIQMAAGFCSLINGGNYYVPHVLKRLLDDDGNVVHDIEPVLVRKTISKADSDYLRTYLQAEVEEATAYAAGV
ncbi:penicillin-binding transpeptidase domain-containing protein, partial [Coprococcus eutactus]|uniref:penicillin-binding transpeptidase domain-containing protein n=1 Tax=Coprococcus eutactus TaxID=33043 RepID=UPI002109D126